GAGAFCLEVCAAFGVINDNDTAQPLPNLVPPTLQVSNASVTEGDISLFLTLAHRLTFDVSLSAQSNNTVLVDYATGSNRGLPGTVATGGAVCGVSADYVSTSGTLRFDPGQTHKSVTVTVCADNLPEANETMVLRLSNPTNAAL